ncbi:hypothetical protein HZA57_06325 [Candidatus Poribacteria bacterium]|nr:hypothetical protein [Candidatus Poribacteria bacterium]
MPNMLTRRIVVLIALPLLLLTATPMRAQEQAPVPAQVQPINSRDYFPAMEKLIASARHSVRICLFEVEFYTQYPDSASNKLITALCDAAKRGVDVTVVIDRSTWRNSGTHDVINQTSGVMLAEAGCSVYLDPDEVLSHQKMAIFDRDIVVVASANWKHYSLNLNNEVGVVMFSRRVAMEYNQYYAQRMADGTLFIPAGTQPAPLANELKPSDLGMTPYSADNVEFLNNRWYFPRAAQAIRRAKTSVELVQNYANYYGEVKNPKPGRPANKPPETDLLLKELIAAHKRGVKVRAVFDLTWSKDYQRPWSSATIEFANRLMAAGIEVYRDDPTVTTHAKMLLIDDEEVIVGSTNWSIQALEENNECSVLVHSPEMVQKVYRPYVDQIFAAATNNKEPMPEGAASGTGPEEE